jgi:hypothetical protein
MNSALLEKVAGSFKNECETEFDKLMSGAMKRKKQANSANVFAQLMRGTKKQECTEAAKVMAKKIVPGSGDPSSFPENIITVLLITEGLGNRNDMNYYGPEAMASAPLAFEGKPCFLDHPSESEERDIPERHVLSKCGYFKNVHTETVDGVLSVVGDLHFDISESGKQGYLKALTALHYRDEFPGLDSEYVGLSINSNGERENRRIEWQGEKLDVNYVTRFVDAFSCDIVTSPARGGRFLALVESVAGAKHHRGGSAMDELRKCLDAAHSALKEAVKETDSEKLKTKLAEADKLFDDFITKAEEASKKSSEKKKEDEDEAEAEKKKEDEAKAKAKAAKMKKEKKEGCDSEDEDDGEDEKDDDDDAVESRRIAITSLAKESGVELPEEKVEALIKMPLKEAKQEISFYGNLIKSATKKAISTIGVPAARFASMNEAERKEAGAQNNGLFADCKR